MRIAVALLILSSCAFGNLTHAQYCNPAVVSYLVRDEKGDLLGRAELRAIYEQLPKSIGDARTHLGEVSLADDGRTFYRPASNEWGKGKKMPALEFINNETCTMHLTEVTLTYQQKRMRLIFNVDIERSQPVIESLPFQEGAFDLDLSGWSHEDNRVIPSTSWKRVKEKK